MIDEREEIAMSILQKDRAIGPMHPEIVIGCIRSATAYMDIIFTHGGCWKFYIILKSIWPEAVPYLTLEDGHHIITEINGSFYDITGKVKRPRDAQRMNPALVMTEKPHLWACPLHHLNTMADFYHRNKDVALAA